MRSASASAEVRARREARPLCHVRGLAPPRTCESAIDPLASNHPCPQLIGAQIFRVLDRPSSTVRIMIANLRRSGPSALVSMPAPQARERDADSLAAIEIPIPTHDPSRMLPRSLGLRSRDAFRVCHRVPLW